MLAFSEIQKSFGTRRVLDRLSFHVEKGEVYGLLGPNGAGKTTAINILCGLLKSDSGDVLVAGRAVSRETRTVIGIAPQELSIYENLTCRQNLRFFGHVFGVPPAAIVARISELSSAFGIDEYLDTEVAHLSGGWRRRVNMAIALVHSPSLLILDEPTVGVDVEARYELWQLITHLRHEDVTILLTTHHLEEAESLCRRIGILADGRIAAEGSLEELRDYVPGELLLVVRTDSQEMARSRASELGWAWRDYGGKLTFMLPERVTIPEVVDLFDGVPLQSLTLEEVGLEHIYLEVTQSANHDSLSTPETNTGG
ncbi:MAG: ABC transporter ATP-binding protein [Rhodothermales bacterium]|nr:ABC transporter ATP-binding protein [Rhodothermales bacterium]